MKPKEKAEELYNKLYNTNFHGNSIKVRELLTKKCALIAVEEILNIKSVDTNYDLSNYWEEVKQEIENL